MEDRVVDAKWAGAFLLTSLAAAALAADGDPETARMFREAPLRWLGVEVVTNDFARVERVRRAAELEPGTVLPVTDSRLQKSCDAIRRELPAASIRCFPVLGAKVDGLAQAVYVVEVDVAKRPPLAPPHCDSAATLDPALERLADEWMSTLVKTMLDGDPNAEQVNAGNYLDYVAAGRHELAERIHAGVESQIPALEAAAASCSAEQRADAVYLMNFTGNPQRAIAAATLRLDDPDSGVRNAAMRLLGTFVAFLSQPEVSTLAVAACSNAIAGDFTDRNKSVLLLNELSARGALEFADLDRNCRVQITNIARTSVATQTGEPARQLLETARKRGEPR
jgi:hypothetical protein